MNEDITRRHGFFEWTFKGVDFSIPGNGGINCRDYLSLFQRWVESIAACIVALLAIGYALPRLKLPEPCSCRHHEPLGKRILLLSMCLTFGIELGFKFATGQMIWIGNPCHVVTMIQIFILAAPPSKTVMAVFRLHMHMLAGAPIAILFPVINARLLPFEIGVYFIQHILMLVIPFYLLYVGDPFIPEPLEDFKWALISLGLLFIYHFVPLQILSYMTHVNLNNMLCPAVSDPFHGSLYRIFAIGHQFVIILTLGKVIVITARACKIMPRNVTSNVSYVSSCESRYSSQPTEGCSCLTDKRIPNVGCSGDCLAEGEHDQKQALKIFNKVNKGSNFQTRSCCYCGNCVPSSFGIHSHKNCVSSPELSNSKCANGHNFLTQDSVNGHLVSKSRDDATELIFHDGKKLLEKREVVKNSQNNNTMLRDSELSDVKFYQHRACSVSQQENPQNGHAKFH